MLEISRSVSLQNRIVVFVDWEQLVSMPWSLKLGDVLIDDAGQRFVLTGLSSPRGGERLQAAVVLRPADGVQNAPVGHLRPST